MSKWEKVKLGDVGIIITGNTPPTNIDEYYISNDIPFYRPNDIKEDVVVDLVTPTKYVAEQARKKCRIIPSNSVLVTCIGIIGKVAITSSECTCNQQINAIIPYQETCDCRYLAYTVLSAKKVLQNIANAPVVPIINKTQFSNTYIPLPPIEQQRKIAATLDVVSDLLKMRKQQLAELDKLVKSQFTEMFGDLVTNPMGWEVKSLYDIADYYIGLTYKPTDEANDGVIVLRSGNIQNGQIVLSDILRVNKKIPDKLFVKNKDILMCSRNGSEKLVGKVALIENPSESMTFGAFMTIVRSRHYRYLLTFFENEAFRAQITSAKTTTINQITKAMLDRISIPLPPLALQKRFADFVESADKFKHIIQQSIDQTQALFDSLMNEYFE